MSVKDLRFIGPAAFFCPAPDLKQEKSRHFVVITEQAYFLKN